MAWNEPGGGKKDKDPWGGKKNNQGPPDLDEVMKKLQDKFGGAFGGGSGNGVPGSPMKLFGGLGVLALLAWFFFGFYQVSQGEEAVILRFGSYNTTVGPGLQWNPPLIDRVYKVDVQRLESMSARANMLTIDENIVEVALVVQYRIGSAKDYVLEMSQPEAGLHHATESALRHVVGSTSMSDVITEGREVMGQQVHVQLQEMLDRYHSGLDVRKVSIQASDPPKAVKDSFDDVIKAKEDKERLKNEAESYANGIIPEARGYAQRVFEEASGYKEEVTARAEGEANRFGRVLTEYQKAPGVTRQRLYIEAMESVLANSTKIMVDIDGGNNMIYLPLDKIMNRSQSYNQSQQLSSADSDVLQNAIRRGSSLTDRARTIQDIRRREAR
ncbi:MAG: FtsH protease activity modulator HflK [Pseudomonadales bacterium]|nr:FtsH protease activity modulator HflK [Pseudomonadales bacterium]